MQSRKVQCAEDTHGRQPNTGTNEIGRHMRAWHRDPSDGDAKNRPSGKQTKRSLMDLEPFDGHRTPASAVITMPIDACQTT